MALFGLTDGFVAAFDVNMAIAESGNFDVQSLFNDFQIAVLRADKLLNQLIVKSSNSVSAIIAPLI